MTIAVGQPINAADLLAIQTTANAAAAAATQLASTVATAKTEADTALAAASSAQQAANSALASATPGGLPDGTVAANISGVQAPSSPVTLTALLDAVISRSVGAIMTRSSAGWTAIPPGIAGQVLQSGGQGQPVSWITLPTIPATTATAPGGTPALVFGTSTSTTQPLTITAATGTVTSYQVKVSTASGMTFPSTWSTIGSVLTLTITGLTAGTTYYYTVTAFNGTTAGTTSSVQNHATAAAVTPPQQTTVSPSGTRVTTTTGSIYDANGVTWTITTGGQVAVNGTADGTTANVIELAYVGGLIYQENASLDWYSKAKPTDSWVQTTSPFTTTPPVVQTGTGTVLPGGSSNPPVVAPLTGTVSKVTKVYKTLNGTAYILIPPANYDATKRYPMLVFLHQDDQGNPYYQGGQGNDIVGPQIEPWFNNTGFLTNFPCFVVAVLANQTTQSYDGEINYGGYGNGTQVPQTATVAIVKSVISLYPIDTARIYCTGNSMGGTGTIVEMILNNTINGTQGKIFAAGLALAAVDYDHSSGSGSNYTINSSVITQFQSNVPLISIHGASDSEQPADRFALPLYKALGGVGGNAAGMSLSRAGSTNYYMLIDSQLGHDCWDTYYAWPRAQTYFNMLFSYTAAATTTTVPTSGYTVSPNGTVVSTVGSALTDASGNVWTITAGAQMALGGTALSNTGSVVQLAIVSGVIWHKNSAGSWYSVVSISGGAVTFSGGTTVSPLSSSTPVTTGTGVFKIQNGLIIDPDGNNFIARGINVYDGSQSSVITNAACEPLLTKFPGLNFVRMPCYNYDAPSTYQTFINRATAKKIVVLLEHHVAAGGGTPPLSGSALTAESNWFTSLANAYKTNPYVWFGTLNEPGGPGSTLTAQHVSNYNAIRGAGANNIIVHNTLGDYNTGVLVVGSGHGLTPNSAYAAMSNIVWDMHIYNGLPHFQAGDGQSYSTNQTQLNTMVANYMTQSQTIQSADGVVPVMILEYGVSTADDSPDPGGTKTCIAVQQSGHGCAAWNWRSGGFPDDLTDGSGNLTSYGQQVAGWIASAAA
jgi:poly(3-hydroxybutyrate) depolymerase